MQTPAGRGEPSITHNITHFCASVINGNPKTVRRPCAYPLPSAQILEDPPAAGPAHRTSLAGDRKHTPFVAISTESSGLIFRHSSPDRKHTPVDTHILPCWTGTDLALSTGDDSSCHRRDANASAGLCSS